MSANDVVVHMLRITSAFGLQRVHVDVTYASISASHYPGRGQIPATFIRVVKPHPVNYRQVRALDQLSQDIQDALPLAEATAAFDHISTAAEPYPAWIATAASAGVAAGIALLFTTDWRLLLVTLVTGATVHRLLAGMGRRRLPPFLQQLAGSALITAIAAGATVAAAHRIAFFAGLDPTLVVVGGVVMLLAGSMFVGAVQDAIDQFYVTAAARVLEVVLRTAGIVVGIVLALAVARNLGAPVTISSEQVALGPVPAQFVAATVAPGLFAVSVSADLVTTALAAVLGLLAWSGYTATVAAGGGSVLSSTTGALLAALVATLVVRHTSVPGFGLVNAALLPLVPGLSLYTGLIQIVGTAPATGAPAAGAATLFLALRVALGIAAGATVGTSLGRPLADRLRRLPA